MFVFIRRFSGAARGQEGFISRQGYKSFTGKHCEDYVGGGDWDDDEGRAQDDWGDDPSSTQVVSAKANEAKDKAEAFKAQRAQRHDRCFTLLVIDDQNTDWSKVPQFFQTLSIYQIYGIPHDAS